MYAVSEQCPNAYRNADDRPIITGPRDTVGMFRNVFVPNRESFVVVFLDTRHRAIDLPYVVSIGTLNASLVHPREVFREAIRRGAAAIICGHNHPSNSVKPSQDDIKLTRRLDSAGTLLGITLLDHVIITDNDWLSLREAREGF